MKHPPQNAINILGVVVAPVSQSFIDADFSEVTRNWLNRNRKTAGAANVGWSLLPETTNLLLKDMATSVACWFSWFSCIEDLISPKNLIWIGLYLCREDSELAILGLCGYCDCEDLNGDDAGRRSVAWRSFGIEKPITMELVKIYFWSFWGLLYPFLGVHIFDPRPDTGPPYVCQTPQKSCSDSGPNKSTDLQPFRECMCCTWTLYRRKTNESSMPEPVGCTWSPPKCGWKSLERWILSISTDQDVTATSVRKLTACELVFPELLATPHVSMPFEMLAPQTHLSIFFKGLTTRIFAPSLLPGSLKIRL